MGASCDVTLPVDLVISKVTVCSHLMRSVNLTKPFICDLSPLDYSHPGASIDVGRSTVLSQKVSGELVSCVSGGEYASL